LVQGCGVVNTLTVRALDSGDVRVRDGQTLVLTGVISDSDFQVIRKWPILGDIPLVGQFFRDTSGTRKKRELVILVTPKIVNDSEGGAFGYGYRPETREAARLLGS
jgi:type IV pilus assembly protein PilQ